MAFYKDVQPGQRFKPSAQRENDISHLLNSLNDTSGYSIDGGKTRQCNEISVNCSGTFTQGVAVMFGTTAYDDKTLDAIPFNDVTFESVPSTPFGVMCSSGTNAIANCAISGFCRILMNTASTATATSFVKPSTNGLFEYAQNGFSLVIAPATNGYAIADISRGSGEVKMYWAEQTGSGAPASGIAVNLYDKPNGTLKGSGTAYAEPINTSVEITGARFWVVENKVTVLTEEQP